MRLLKVLLVLFVVLALVMVLLKNAEMVTVDLIVRRFVEVPLAVVLVATLTVGILVGFGLALISVITGRMELRKLRAENVRISEELNSLRNVAIEEGIYEVGDGGS